MASRLHCGISFLDGFFIRDFKSRNGTFVNDQPIEVYQIKTGDRIASAIPYQCGRGSQGQNRFDRVERCMAKGKGYHTILHEI